jgi:hypothetical protein
VPSFLQAPAWPSRLVRHAYERPDENAETSRGSEGPDAVVMHRGPTEVGRGRPGAHSAFTVRMQPVAPIGWPLPLGFVGTYLVLVEVAKRRLMTPLAG